MLSSKGFANRTILLIRESIAQGSPQSQKNVHFMIRPEHGNRHAQNQPYSQQSKLHQEYYLTQIQNGGGGSVQPPKSSFNVPNQHKNSQMHASQSNYERDNCFGRVSNNTIITNVPFATENQLLNIQTNSSTIMMQNGLLIDISAKTNMPNQEKLKTKKSRSHGDTRPCCRCDDTL